MAMDKPAWHFKKRAPSDEVVNPIQGEFFNKACDSNEQRQQPWVPAVSLVREAIQNSLDARAEDDPVRVRFYLSGGEGLPADRARAWFDSLRPHLCATRSHLRVVAPEAQACRFVVVEDFNTRGLEGDPRRGTIPDEGEPDDFFAFFRASALSGKTGKEGGRWGVGKSVFNRASRINSFLALTVRKSDGAALLIGRCFLLTHRIGDKGEFHPYGRFGVPDADDPDFILPVEDPATIDALRRDFRLARERSTPGLSVVVPYADEDITFDAIRSAVIREYFWPILTERLTVHIAGAGREPVRLDPGTLLASVDGGHAGGMQEDLRSLIEFAIEAHTFPQSGIVPLEAPGSPPQWNDSLLPEHTRHELARRYERGDLLALRVPLEVREKGSGGALSNFLVYVRRDRNGRGYRPVFIRSGLIIPEVYKQRIGGHSVYALVIIDDAPLASMLGDAETPAHTDWSPHTGNFRDKYQYGRAVIDFVKQAPARIVDMLTRPDDEPDRLTLADFFPAEPDDEGLPDKAAGDGKGREPEPPPEPAPPKRPHPFRTDKIKGPPVGFRVVRDNRDQTPLPDGLDIQVAYDTSRGDPLRKYHPADFDLARLPIAISTQEAEIVEAELNRLLVRLTGEDFRIEVTGFDENRDLHVEVSDGAGTAAPAGGPAAERAR